MHNRESDLKFVQEFFEPKKQADSDWYWWHLILGKYFAKPQWWAAPWQYYLSMVHTASWAVILLMVFNHHSHWFAWILCLVGVFFGNGSSWFSGGDWSDRYALDQTAMLLRALRPLPEPERKVEKE